MASNHFNGLVIAANRQDMRKVLLRMAENLSVYKNGPGIDVDSLNKLESPWKIFCELEPAIEGWCVESLVGAPFPADVNVPGRRGWKSPTSVTASYSMVRAIQMEYGLIDDDSDRAEGAAVAPTGHVVGGVRSSLKRYGEVWALELEYITRQEPNTEDIDAFFLGLPEGKYGVAFLDADSDQNCEQVAVFNGLHHGRRCLKSMTKRDLKEDSCLRAFDIVCRKIEFDGRKISKQAGSLPKLARELATLNWTHLSFDNLRDYTSCDDFDDPEVDEVEASAEVKTPTEAETSAGAETSAEVDAGPETETPTKAKSPAAAKAPLKSKTNDAGTKLPGKTKKNALHRQRTYGMKVEGRRFDIDVPDNWYVAHGDEANGRPFVAAIWPPREGEDIEFPTYGGVSVLYCELPDIDLDKEGSVWSHVKTCGVRDFIHAIHMVLNYPNPDTFEGIVGPKFVSEEIIEANGVACEVLKVKQLFDDYSTEYHIKPLALDNCDYLRCIACNSYGIGEKAFHKLVCDIASSVTQHSTIVPKCEEQLDRALREKISVSDFNEMVSNFAIPYAYVFSLSFEPVMNRAEILNPNLSQSDLYLKLYGDRAELVNGHYVHWMRLLDAVEAQLAHGTSTADAAAMLEKLWCQEKQLIPQLAPVAKSNWSFIKRHGLFDPTQERLAFEKRAGQLADELGCKLESHDGVEYEGYDENGADEAPNDDAFVPIPNFVLGLLAEDYLYFPDDAISWNGSHHEISRVDVNFMMRSGLMDRVHEAWCADMDDIEEVSQFLVNILNEIEEDEALHVPKELISDIIRGPVCDGMNIGAGGDLTGITLANLAAMASSIRLDDEVSRDTYTLMYDTRLVKGIPQFFNLMGRLIWDMRACSKSLTDKPFTVNFVGVRNVDADALYGDEPVRSVPGAQRARKSLVVKSAPEITLPEVAKAALAKESKTKGAKPKAAADKPSPTKTTKAKSAKAMSDAVEDEPEKPPASKTAKAKPAADNAEKTPASKTTKAKTAKSKADSDKAEPAQSTTSKAAKAKGTAAKPESTEGSKAKSATSKATKSKPAKAKSAADETGTAKPATSKTKKTAPAKPKKPAPTLEQLLDQMHDRVEADIEHGAPAVNPATTMRAVRKAMYSAGGNGSMFDDTIAELDRQFRAGEIPPRTPGEDDLADDKPLGRVVNMLRTSGGGLAKETVVSRLGEEALSAASSDPAVVERDGKLYLWCHRDEAGKPMRDHKQAILTLEKREKKAEEAYAAGKPFSEERLREVDVERTKAILALNNAGFFAFGKKKELKARIAALEERTVLEKSRAAKAQIDDARKKLAAAKENAENEYKQRGLL